MKDWLKLYMTESSVGDNLILFIEKPNWDNLCGYFVGSVWHSFMPNELRAAGFTRKFPTGKQILTVRLTIK